MAYYGNLSDSCRIILQDRFLTNFLPVVLATLSFYLPSFCHFPFSLFLPVLYILYAIVISLFYLFPQKEYAPVENKYAKYFLYIISFNPFKNPLIQESLCPYFANGKSDRHMSPAKGHIAGK